MSNNIDRNLFQIAFNILKCDRCFNKDIVTSQFPFTPEIPPYTNEDAKKKIIIIGINPGMTFTQKQYKKQYEEAFQSVDKNIILDKFSEEDINKYNKIMRGIRNDDRNVHQKINNIYQRTLAKFTDLVNRKLSIIKLNENDIINTNNFYDYVYWGNISFCPTPNVSDLSEKILVDYDENNTPIYESIFIKTLVERLDCCSNYLSQILKHINPDLIIIANDTYKEKIIAKIRKMIEDLGYNFDSTTEKYSMYLEQVDIKFESYLSNADNKKSKFIFSIPHPRSRKGRKFDSIRLSRLNNEINKHSKVVQAINECWTDSGLN